MKILLRLPSFTLLLVSRWIRAIRGLSHSPNHPSPHTRIRAIIVGLVALAGAALGWDAAAATHSSRTHGALSVTPVEIVSLHRTSTLVIVPMPQSPSSEARQAVELARLKARNRRLEALVRVSRNRRDAAKFRRSL